MQIDNDFRERITTAIQNSGKNQAELAERIEVSKATISQWVNGPTRNLRMQHLFKLADETGVNARWIAVGEGPEIASLSLDEAELKLVSLFRDLDSNDRDRTIAALQITADKKSAVASRKDSDIPDDQRVSHPT